MSVKVITNNHVRPFIYGWQLTEEERQQFDYYDDEEVMDATFFAYNGGIYDLGEFVRVEHTRLPSEAFLYGWDAYMSDSFFSGIVIKFAPDDYNEEGVIVGRYCS